MTADEIKALLKSGAAPGGGRMVPPHLHFGGQRGPAARRAGAGHGHLLPARSREPSPRCTCSTPTRSSTSISAIRWRCCSYYPDGRSAVFTLGPDLAAGQHVQFVVPAGVWQGTRLVEGGKVALLGCTVTPGFDFADYRSGSYAELAAKWPAEAERIRKLTRR